MTGKTLRIVILTAALLALGAVTGIALKPREQVEDPAPRLTRLEERVDDLSARQAAVEQAVTPAAEVDPRVEEQRPKGTLQAMQMRANEVAAIATLRNIVCAQVQLQVAGMADTDHDGMGEYGGFLELSGARPGRMTSALVPPVLSTRFRNLDVNGEVTTSGYHFAIYLPGSKSPGEGVAEPAEAGYGAGDGIDADLAETTWCCYAWPVRYRETGMRTFYVNQFGDILAVDAAAYSGTGRGPACDAAFQRGAPASTITGEAAVDAEGRDGNVWRTVN